MLKKTDSDSSVGHKPPVVDNGKPYGLSDVVVPRNDHYLAIFTFCMMGNTQLLIWNMVLNSIDAMSLVIWPGYIFSDLMGGFEHGAALLVSIAMLKVGGLNSRACHIAGVFNAILFLIFPLVPQFFHAEVVQYGESVDERYFDIVPGKGNILVAQILLSVVSVFLGICAGLMHVYGYAFASILPKNYVGYVSTGNGIAGALSFSVYLPLIYLFEWTQRGQIRLIWTFFIFGSLSSVVQVVCFYRLSEKSWFKECVEISRQKRIEDAERTLSAWGQRRSFFEIFKDCWLQAFNASFTLFVTLLLFPMTGPYNWKQPKLVSVFLIGTFQILDLLLRWFPVLGGWTQIPKKWLTSLVLLRPLVFIPLFLLPAENLNLNYPFFGKTWWLFILMILFTVTSGWFTTCASIHCPECVEHPAEKEIASEIFVIALLAFITAGVFSSKLPRL